MSDHRSRNHDARNNDGFRILCGVAMIFLAVVLAINGVRQLGQSHIVSGVIGLLGTGLLLLAGAMLLGGLIKRLIVRKKK